MFIYTAAEKDSNNPDGFEPIQDDDVHRFHGEFEHLHVPSGLNGTTEQEFIDHGEHDYPGMMDDYVARRGREEYYYHYGRRHRVHSAYMDDYFGGTGRGVSTSYHNYFIFLTLLTIRC